MYSLAVPVACALWRLAHRRAPRAGRVIRDPHLLVAKYANRWASQVLGRAVRGWPLLKPGDTFTDKKKSLPEPKPKDAEEDVTLPTAPVFAAGLEQSLAEAGLGCEGRILQALRSLSAPRWVRVGGAVGLSEGARAAVLAAGEARPEAPV